ncbi:outer membrane protein assembly factor BamE [Aliiroseovarius sp.]|uniref:outer membrane protein assembly factor BamE n=1 Tax=Aliiroseovarius sp. TaxID=1872442 RepID=UPI00260496BF|nr:outer membrane protein assembly factor BamE [Aliiroseovarius sp.]
MSIQRSIVKGLTGLAIIAVLSACSATYRNHGYAPSEEELSFVVVGVDTRDTVAAAFGKPGTAGLLTEGGWYYVQSRFKSFGPRKPEEIERELLAVSFDEDGVVENIERFGLEDGRVVVLSRRVTDSNIKGVSFIRQLLGSIGRVNAEDLL